MCVTTAYGVQCLVAGCRGSVAGQQAMRPGRGIQDARCLKVKPRERAFKQYKNPVLNLLIKGAIVGE